MTFWGKLAELVDFAVLNEPTECVYSPLRGGQFNYEIVVAAYHGWREGGMVFCPSEHAALDQKDAIF